jgi:phosphate transport system substrate-binding protein
MRSIKYCLKLQPGMQRFKSILLGIAAAVLLAACEDDSHKPTDTLSSGNIDISVDETYEPIIKEQLKVFDSSFPDAHIKATYKPESECIKDFMDGKARLILVTRELNANEKQVLTQNKVVPTSLAVAKDAVALVVNQKNTDTTLSISQIRGILTGVYNKKYTVVFDHQGSSTVRYVLDSLIPGQKLGANVYAAKSNKAVVDYVKENEEAIGFVGMSYISDMEDAQGLAFIKDVRVVAVYNDSLNRPYQPYQAYIAPNWYPLTRNLYYIHRETYPGLGTGLANFLTRERGQLIFKQARLFPLRTNIIFREAAVNQ